jgi:preprotein translocase subunit YajC
MYTALVLAQDAPPAPPPNGTTNDESKGGGMESMLLVFGLIFVVMYFLMIRPQKKQQKQRRAMLSEMAKNDHVVSIGGIRGVIYSVSDTEVVLKVDERNDVRITMAKSAIARILTDEDLAAETA